MTKDWGSGLTVGGEVCDGARLMWQADMEFLSDGVYHVMVHSEQGLLFLLLG
jgi:hypothetical protein